MDINDILNYLIGKKQKENSMWEDLSNPWKICFEEAWEAYCNGSIPIGAVIVTREGEVISKGRNMVFEDIKDTKYLNNSKIAHAEMNAIYASESKLNESIIYSTMEPCVMCFGAIVMNGITEVKFAARDGLAGGVNLSNEFIDKRKIKIYEYHKILEIVQIAIKADYIYRNFGDRAEELLKYWEITCPNGISIGEKWYKTNRLVDIMKRGGSIKDVMNECNDEIKVYHR